MRESTAIEASDRLDTVIHRLEQLVTVPPRRAFTVALTSPGHEEGAQPWLFVVNATDLDTAYRTLTRLPSYHQWLRDIRAPGADTVSPGDAELVLSESHPGTRPYGAYEDLRDEQAQSPAEPTAPGRLP
ncbi:hypothetical protein DMH15_31285, partial [Streptomyces sp. WAC 06725]|uniref:hypothetical protein n=1 Tax=Streptomyces sp. WAC 06725 TaxID=2203209 RepID=UPI001000C1B8